MYTRLMQSYFSLRKCLFVIILVCTILIVCIKFESTLQLTKPFQNNFVRRVIRNESTGGAICVQFVAGLGNNIFQFASAFGISRTRGRSLLISDSSRVAKTFKIHITFKNINAHCKQLPVIKESKELFATYDPEMIRFNLTGDLRVGSYLQSWKYFVSSNDELKQQLLFQNHIQKRADYVKKSILRNQQSTSVTLVGVHVRRGDMVNNKLGFQVATPDYLKKAVRYFQLQFKNTLFVIASNDIPWCKKHMPSNSSFVYIHDKPEIDMAVLALCDHTIMTVGTFGWWCAWLAGGNVTYYKHPAATGTWWDKKMSILDHFPPNWIGL